MIVAFLIFLLIPTTLLFLAIRHRKKTSAIAEEKWEEEDKTVFVPYGNYLIPMLKSQTAKWTAMSDDEKWWMLGHLQKEAKEGRIATEKENGITRFVGITNKAKDIKHRQKQRTEGWKTSQEKN
jgi:uncharacterized membrane protein